MVGTYLMQQVKSGQIHQACWSIKPSTKQSKRMKMTLAMGFPKWKEFFLDKRRNFRTHPLQGVTNLCVLCLTITVHVFALW
jgi:hypothetical protein